MSWSSANKVVFISLGVVAAVFLTTVALAIAGLT